MVQQAIALLIDHVTTTRSITDDVDEVPRPLPHDPGVYRRGFLFSITRANDVNCLIMLRMRRQIFWRLCKVLVEAGGLERTKNIEVDEMVAMLLLTIGHNAKNRTCQVLLHRSGETVSRTIKCVLKAILKLHATFLAKPTPVPTDCTDHIWKYFQKSPAVLTLSCGLYMLSNCNDNPRVQSMDEGGGEYAGFLYEGAGRGTTCGERELQGQLFHSSGKNDAHMNAHLGCVVADEAIFSGWLKPEDAASKVNLGAGNSDYMDDEIEHVESYTIPSNLDHNAVMCDLINKGVDIHATSLKEVEAEISSKRTAVVGQKGGTSSGTKRSRQVFMDAERARIAQSMEAANENIARIATNYCIEGDLAVKRKNLYQELCNFPELTPFMRTRILRHLNKDDGDDTTYFQLPTSEEKLAFVWTFLEYSSVCLLVRNSSN
ncbi:hypothetical protein LINPERHAP2_LOCUS24528 [Linum perenne]